MGRGSLRANDALEVQEVDDELVLNDPATGAVHVLNETAAAVWWLSDGNRSPDGIVVEIAKLYRREVRDVEDDVHRVVSELIRIRAVLQQ